MSGIDGARKAAGVNTDIDRDWFFSKLSEKNRSVRGLARHLGLDPSAMSRMLSGNRRMKMEEADKIASFLGEPVGEILAHAGVSLDPQRHNEAIMLAATIDGNGRIQMMSDPQPLPAEVMSRAQAAAGRQRTEIIAAQVRANKGCLGVFDDAFFLFRRPASLDLAAIGTLSICLKNDGTSHLVRLERARKTGEASIRYPTDEHAECVITAATPVLAIIP